MMSIVSSLVKQLDNARRLGVGSEATLVLLKIEPSKGYSPVYECPIGDGAGWALEDKGIGQFQTLHIAENAPCTREVLLEADVFAINGIIYQVADDTEFTAPPEGSYWPEWTALVHPTTEVYP
jgi:hypothetical protein